MCSGHPSGTLRRAANIKRIGVGIAACLAAAVTTLSAVPAQASVPSDFVKNVNTGRCIDDSLAYGLRSFPRNRLSYQNFIYYN